MSDTPIIPPALLDLEILDDSIDYTHGMMGLLDLVAYVDPSVENAKPGIIGFISFCDHLEELVDEAENVGLDMNEILSALCAVMCERAVTYEVPGDAVVDVVSQSYNEAMAEYLAINWKNAERGEG